MFLSLVFAGEEKLLESVKREAKRSEERTRKKTFAIYLEEKREKRTSDEFVIQSTPYYEPLTPGRLSIA